MYENWCHPVETDKIRGFEVLDSSQLGTKIHIHTSDQVPNLKEVHVAILGLGNIESNAVRRELYAMTAGFYGIEIADMGDLRRSDHNFIIPILHDLFDAGIIPVLIADQKLHLDIQYKAYIKRDKPFKMALVDSNGGKLPSDVMKDNIVFDILNRAQSPMSDFSLLGHQAHLVNPEVLKDLQHRNFGVMRLGQAQQDIEETEPFLRDMDGCAFCLSALRYSEAPGQVQNYPSGFYSEEACQLARYAGMSDRLNSFGIYGFKAGIDPTRVTQTMVAQLIWYFLEGVSQRYNENVADLAQRKEYIVHSASLDDDIAFLHSLLSDRWWMRHKKSESQKEYDYIPCSRKDYVAASQGSLPERLYNYLIRD